MFVIKTNEFLSGFDLICVFNSSGDINTVHSTLTNVVKMSIELFIIFLRVNKEPFLPNNLRDLQDFKNIFYKQTKLNSSIVQMSLQIQ